jgi:hypothetical protein
MFMHIKGEGMTFTDIFITSDGERLITNVLLLVGQSSLLEWKDLAHRSHT